MSSNKRSTGDSDVESSEEEEFTVKRGDARKRDSSMNEMEPKDMPPAIKRRVNALRNLQLSVTNLDAAFYMEVHALEVKYMRLYYPYLDKRAEIINGRYEPTDAECHWESESEEQLAITERIEKTKLDESPAEVEKKDEDVKGIPGFWLTIFKNVSLLCEMVQEHDEPILNHLEDIKVIMLEKDPMGFVLEFQFSPNEYFTNSVLTKEYNMKCQPDHDHPFDFEGPEIHKCIGCSIMWCKDKNVTVKAVKKRQKHKSRGSVRTVVKTVPADSFFNFFNPPELPADPTTEVAESTNQLLSTDFEIGHYIRERVVPFAVLLFTGEGLDDEEEYEEEEEEEENESEINEESSEESSEEEENVTANKGNNKKKAGRVGRGRGPRHPSTNDESNDEAVKEPKRTGRKAGGNKGAQGAAPVEGGANPQNPAECKQQ